jgi:DNA ligase (NAD+)
VGENIARILATEFGSVDRLMEATEDALAAVHGIGPRIAASVALFFGQDENRRVIAALRQAGVRMEEATSAGPKPLLGKTFVLTGGLETMTREEAKATIQRLGGRVASTVSKNTHFVVVGTDPGSKAENARRLGIPMLEEAAFRALVNL